MSESRYHNPLKRHLAAHGADVPDHLRAGVRAGRVFHKRAYAEALAYFDYHRDRGTVLCHGTVCLPDGPPFAHA
ncbi:MAG: hypothetical protein K2X87_16225 [Gemmataceae bacterium]|nr:hypothetical protein [Gemmataceae bacterium]